MLENCSKPNFSPAQASDILMRLYDLTTSQIHPLPSYDDQNFYVSSTNGNEYVLKISNSEDSKNPTVIEVQTFAMSFLHENGIPTQKGIFTVTGQLMSIHELDCGFGLQKYLVRLLSYLPGKIISKVPLTPQLLYETGKMAAKIDKVLQKMEHPSISVLDRDNFNWKLSNLPALEKSLFVLDGERLQEVVKSVIGLFKSFVAPKYPYFRKCINHGDFNDFNVLVQPDNNGIYKICGIIDFGDMNSGFYIHELATAIMHMMVIHPNPIEVGGAVLAGWESELPLNNSERDSLYVLVLSRFCQTVCYVRQSLLTQPENEYLIMWSKRVEHILWDFWKLNKEHVEITWFHDAHLQQQDPL
ncbi:hydroxylysine kinase-like [Periophthalmus magnuspinnatus]|uniref:hydroxylysine kinase-like n=1 Tax=Periophthalmus magnuspinnatus TaxID=409849 RepID=UPI0024363558|nr:hydroxylysine kinase-like [Periophthalmus magnuspinnatus]